MRRMMQGSIFYSTNLDSQPYLRKQISLRNFCTHLLPEVPPFNCCLTRYFCQSIDPFCISHILAHEASLLTWHQGNRNIHEFFFVPWDFLLDSQATHCSLFFLMLCLLETLLCRSSLFFTLKGNTFPYSLWKLHATWNQSQQCSMKGHFSWLEKDYSQASSHLQDLLHITWASGQSWQKRVKRNPKKGDGKASSKDST